MAKQTNAFIRNACNINSGSEAAEAVRDLSHQETGNLRFMALADIDRMMPDHCHVIWCVSALAVVERADYGYRKVSVDPMDGELIASIAPQDISVPAVAIACGVNKVGRGYFGTLVYDPSQENVDYQVSWDPETGYDERTLIATCFAEAYLHAQELGAFNKAP